MATFPGDPPVRVDRVRALASGDPYNLSQLALGSHTGTHLDPPVHFISGGRSIDQIDLTKCNGPVEVVRVPDGATIIGAAEVGRVPDGVERVIFRTRNSTRWRASDQFFPDYVAVDLAAAEALMARRIGLVGIDALSIELDTSGRFPVHHRLLGSGALVLEGLLLGNVEPGRYELRCLPLRIVGGDGGPCRAILVREA